MTDGRRSQRTVKPTRVPGIPKPPADVPASLQRYLSNLGEALEIRLGRKGDVRDRAITLRELIDSGMAVDLKNNPYDPNNPGGDFTQNNDPVGGDVEFPTAPTGFSATVGFSNVGLFWDYPETQYRGHSYTEIFRNTSNNQATAQLIGSSPGNAYTDFHGTVTSTTTYYYWARHVNVNEDRGPFHSSNGVAATLSVSTDYLLTLLTDSIASSHLVQSLRDPIANLPANTNASIVAVETDVTALEAQYTVKIQTNSSNGTYVSGYGLANTTASGTTTSAFIVAADRFAVINPTTYNVGQTNNNPASTYTPFVVQSTATNITLPSGEVVPVPAGVYIDSAFISKARILDLIAGSVQADFLLASSFVRAPNIHGGTFNIGTFSQNGSSDPSNWTITGSNRVSNFSVDANGIMHCEAAELKAITVKADDDTILLDSGGLRGAIGNNYAYNSHFNEGSTGWTTNGTIGATVIFGYDSSAQKYYVETAAGYWVQTELDFPISTNEPIYVFGESYGNHGYYALVQYTSNGGTNGLFALGTSGANAPSPPWSTATEYRIKQFNVTSGYVRGKLRIGSQSLGTTTRHYFAGVSTTPPVLDSSYASTYIKSLYVTDLTGDVNTITSFEGSAFKTTGPSSAQYREMFTVICEQNSQAAIYHEATISGCFSAKYATDTANIKLEWRARNSRDQVNGGFGSWNQVNILKQRSAGGGSSFMNLPFAGGTGVSHNVDVQFRVSVYMSNDNDNGTTNASRSSTMEYSGTTIGVV